MARSWPQCEIGTPHTKMHERDAVYSGKLAMTGAEREYACEECAESYDRMCLWKVSSVIRLQREK